MVSSYNSYTLIQKKKKKPINSCTIVVLIVDIILIMICTSWFLSNASHSFKCKQVTRRDSIEKEGSNRSPPSATHEQGELTYNDPSDTAISTEAFTDSETKPPGWPIRVTCEMDIGAWVDAMTRAGLRSKYSDVIKGFTTGFDQGIPDHVIRDQTTGSPLPFYLPPNHSSA